MLDESRLMKVGYRENGLENGIVRNMFGGSRNVFQSFGQECGFHIPKSALSPPANVDADHISNVYV